MNTQNTKNTIYSNSFQVGDLLSARFVSCPIVFRTISFSSESVIYMSVILP